MSDDTFHLTQSTPILAQVRNERRFYFAMCLLGGVRHGIMSICKEHAVGRVDGNVVFLKSQVYSNQSTYDLARCLVSHSAMGNLPCR